MSRHYAVEEDLFIDLYQAAFDEADEETLMEARRAMREEYLPDYGQSDADLAFAFLMGALVGTSVAAGPTYHDLESLYPEVVDHGGDPFEGFEDVDVDADEIIEEMKEGRSD